MSENTVDTDDTATDAQGGEVADASAEGTESLGDAGKKALAAMKEREKAARAKARDLEKEIAELKAAAEAANKTPDEQALDAARREAEANAIAKANQRVLRSEIRAAAAGQLSDPSDALAHLDLSGFGVDEHGNVDTQEISEAISDLLEKKPYLAAQGGRVSFDSGRGKQPAGGQLTQADLRGMSPEDIASAKAAGRLNNLLGRG